MADPQIEQRLKELAGITLPRGNYQLLELIASGHMSVVYKGRDISSNRTVAIKILVDDKYLWRFKAEAELGYLLNIANVASTIRAEMAGETLNNGLTVKYLVMKWIDGDSLGDVIRNHRMNPLPTPQLLQFTVNLLQKITPALERIHAANIIHRDIKPNNIHFNNDAIDKDEPYLLDFGIAKWVQVEQVNPLQVENEEKTKVWEAPGTHKYMPPEQWDGEAIARSDEYALALLVYEVLSDGYSPFEKTISASPSTFGTTGTDGRRRFDWERAHREVQPLPIQEYRPDIPQAVWQVLLRAMSKNPLMRYETITKFTDAFVKAVREPSTPIAPPPDMQRTLKQDIREFLPPVMPPIPPPTVEPPPKHARTSTTQRFDVPKPQSASVDKPAVPPLPHLRTHPTEKISMRATLGRSEGVTPISPLKRAELIAKPDKSSFFILPFIIGGVVVVFIIVIVAKTQVLNSVSLNVLIVVLFLITSFLVFKERLKKQFTSLNAKKNILQKSSQIQALPIIIDTKSFISRLTSKADNNRYLVQPLPFDDTTTLINVVDPRFSPLPFVTDKNNDSPINGIVESTMIVSRDSYFKDFHLVIVDSPEIQWVGTIYEFNAECCTIGRTGCDINITNDIYISRPHTQISFKVTGIEIVDLDTDNGTSINRIKLLQKQSSKIEIGSSITIGKTTLILGLKKPTNMPNLDGRTFKDKYELRSEIRKTGKSTIYRVWHITFKKEFAMKILSPDLTHYPGYKEQFENEARNLVGLQHSNIVTIRDCDTYDGYIYIVMDLIEGGSFDKNKIYDLGKIASIIWKIASALDYAHSKSVIHGGIKTNSIVFDNHGEPYLTDFAITQTEGNDRSQTMIGSPIFLAPEQWENSPLTGAVDQYALAVLIYTLVTGDYPVEGQHKFDYGESHLTKRPTLAHIKANEKDRIIPESLSFVLDKALSIKPEDRYNSVTEFAVNFAKSIEPSKKLSKNIFISYQRKPSAMIAQHIEKHLKSHNINVYLDINHQAGPGKVEDRLFKAIDNCDVFVILVASTTFESEWVCKELEYAIKENKELIPVIQDSFDTKSEFTNEMVKKLMGYEGIKVSDFGNQHIDVSLKKLEDMILKIIK